tara:strand:+ start:764 stop:982 length:219 start_codon:yes stop_codon:yes gene_type:complete
MSKMLWCVVDVDVCCHDIKHRDAWQVSDKSVERVKEGREGRHAGVMNAEEVEAMMMLAVLVELIWVVLRKCG